MAMRIRNGRTRITRWWSGGSGARNGIEGCCGGFGHGVGGSRRLTILGLFGPFGIPHLFPELCLFGVEGGGAVGRDVAEGGGPLVGGGGGEGAEEGGGRGG